MNFIKNSAGLPEGQYRGKSGVIYTELEAASEFLAQNQNNIDLNHLRDVVRIEHLPSPGDKPRAILERYLFLPTQETLRFARIASEQDMRPVVATFRETEFKTFNPEKVAALRPTLLWPNGQKTKKQWIVEENERSGELGRCPTIFGITTEMYWQEVRRLRSLSTDLTSDEAAWLTDPTSTYDNSEWWTLLSRDNGTAKVESQAYYLPKTVEYLVSGILFEDFEGGPNADGLQKFVDTRVLPAQEFLRKRTGFAPIVVHLPAKSDNLHIDLRHLKPQAKEELMEITQSVGLHLPTILNRQPVPEIAHD